MTAALAPESPAAHRVGWGFMSVYTLAFMRTNLVFLTPLLVTLPLRSTRWWESNRRRIA
jgi:hypothetical protein